MLNNSWGCDGIDGATMEMELEKVAGAFEAIRPEEADKRDLIAKVIALLRAHQACSKKVLLEMEWGW